MKTEPKKRGFAALTDGEKAKIVLAWAAGGVNSCAALAVAYNVSWWTISKVIDNHIKTLRHG